MSNYRFSQKLLLRKPNLSLHIDIFEILTDHKLQIEQSNEKYFKALYPIDWYLNVGILMGVIQISWYYEGWYTVGWYLNRSILMGVISMSWYLNVWYSIGWYLNGSI